MHSIGFADKGFGFGLEKGLFGRDEDGRSLAGDTVLARKDERVFGQEILTVSFYY